jgi:transketolase
LITQKMAEESSEYRNTTTEADVLKMAARFEQTADKVATFKLADPRLAEFQQQLVGIYRGNGEATRSMVTALASKDILTAKLAQDQVNNIGKQEQQVITAINRYCQAP